MKNPSIQKRLQRYNKKIIYTNKKEKKVIMEQLEQMQVLAKMEQVCGDIAALMIFARGKEQNSEVLQSV